MPEGTYYSDYLKQVHLYTNGHDDTLTSTILPSYSNNIEIHAGTDDVYATVFDADGNKIPGICISVDNEHYLSGEHLTGLKPSTDYTLYYKQGINGTSYKAAFRTGSQGYGVTVGKTQVTAENTGNLEK